MSVSIADALTPAELTDALALRKLVSHPWHIQGTNAINGDGVYESMEALSRLVKDFKKQRHY